MIDYQQWLELAGIAAVGDDDALDGAIARVGAEQVLEFVLNAMVDSFVPGRTAEDTSDEVVYDLRAGGESRYASLHIAYQRCDTSILATAPEGGCVVHADLRDFLRATVGQTSWTSLYERGLVSVTGARADYPGTLAQYFAG